VTVVETLAESSGVGTGEPFFDRIMKKTKHETASSQTRKKRTVNAARAVRCQRGSLITAAGKSAPDSHSASSQNAIVVQT